MSLRNSSSASSDVPDSTLVFGTFYERIHVRTSRWALGTSTVLNAGALAALLLISMRAVLPPSRPPGTHDRVKLSDLTIFAPRTGQAGGGGGGGSNDLIDPITGRQPSFEKAPVTPPLIPLEDPKLAIAPAIAVPPDVTLPDNQSLPNIGVHSSPNVTMLSYGPGQDTGTGIGAHGGSGPGDGQGYGPGSDRGFNSGIYKPGVGGVTFPVPVLTPEAEFSDEARRTKHQGICIVALIVDSRGHPQNPRIVRSLGMGLDEKALEAVKKYTFEPATKNGKPVPVLISIQVDFRLY